MGKERPERKIVEELLKKSKMKKAHDIAGAAGLIETMGYDNAVRYVLRVKRDLRHKGELAAPEGRFATDEERLEDITKLFEIRQGKMSRAAAYTMLLLNCYLRFRSEDDEIHMGAIDDTYAKNRELEDPFPVGAAIQICDVALAQYMHSMDEEQDRAAKAKGYPGAGLNYTSESLIHKLEITDEELQHMRSIRREGNHGDDTI